jgi:ketosteroid isomerase-like protein
VTDDVEAIQRLKARFCRALDTKDWSAYRQSLTDDVTVDTTESGGGIVTGADDFVAVLIDVIGEVSTVHHCHTPEIDLTSPTTATGIWAMEDMLWFPDGAEMHGYGHYHETYRKAGAVWQIASLRLARLRVDFERAT